MTKSSDINLLKGKRILLDPLGGMYYDERLKEWRFQKKPVVETHSDLITSEIAAATYDILRTVGTDVFATRCLRRSSSETGESRHPLYHEGAGQYLRYCRIRPSLRESASSPNLPETVWNDGQTSLDRDSRARINFGKFIKADILVAIDITNYVSDEGLELAHNGVGEAEALGESILKEVSKRTRRKIYKNRELMEEEMIYSKIDIPVVILNCGSSFDPFTTRLLRQLWYREYVSLGIFAGIWKHYMLNNSLSAAGPSSKPE